MDTGAADASAGRIGAGRKLRKSCDFCCLRKRKCDGGGGGLSPCRCVRMGRVMLMPGCSYSACFVDSCCCCCCDRQQCWARRQDNRKKKQPTVSHMLFCTRAWSLAAGPTRCVSPSGELVCLCTGPKSGPSCTRKSEASKSQAIMVGWSRETCLTAKRL